jgi:broad specificity phosphatase PhoE
MESCDSTESTDMSSFFLPWLFVLSMFPILFGGLYGVFATIFEQDRPVVPVNVSEQSFYGKPIRGLGGQRVKHRFVLIRHGESEHNSNLEKGRQDLKVDSPLTCLGHEQAKSVASYFSRIGFIPDNICVSPMLRTRQTAEPTLRLFKQQIESGMIPLIISPKYMEVNTWESCKVGQGDNVYNSEKETFTDFTNRVRDLVNHLETWSDRLEKPTQTLIFTHSMVISELLNSIVNKERADICDDKWSKVYWQVANGSLTCIDLMENDEGRTEWHIQAMNYGKHLTLFSGVKSPFI